MRVGMGDTEFYQPISPLWLKPGKPGTRMEQKRITHSRRAACACPRNNARSNKLGEAATIPFLLANP